MTKDRTEYWREYARKKREKLNPGAAIRKPAAKAIPDAKTIEEKSRAFQVLREKFAAFRAAKMKEDD